MSRSSRLPGACAPQMVESPCQHHKAYVKLVVRVFAQLPANHLAAGQPASKLKEDLFSTANSIELFKEMLAPISATDAADVKQARMILQCAAAVRFRLPRSSTDDNAIQEQCCITVSSHNLLARHDVAF